MSTETLWLLLPETIVIAFAVAIYVLGALVAARDIWPWLGLLAVVGGSVALGMQFEPPLTSGPLLIDSLALYTRWLSLGAGAVLVLLTRHGAEDDTRPEYVGSLLLAIGGLMLVGLSGDLVLLFLGLELISIPTYILLYIGRRGAYAREAAAKYFYLSILSSALFLYGVSFLYGLGGSTDILAIGQRVGEVLGNATQLGSMTGIALVLIFGGLGFRIAAVPFHFYAPDVYEGTSNTNAGLLSVVPKAAGLVALVRLLVIALPGTEEMGWRIAMTLAVLTMTLGNVVALWQNNLRRLLAYSSIAHAGYMLIGLTVGLGSIGGTSARWDGIAAMLFYLAVYAVASVGAFSAMAYLSGPQRQLNNVDELAGLSRTHPLVAAAMALFMFSLAGIPPLAGFWGKLVIFGSALGADVATEPSLLQSPRSWFIALAAIGVLNAAVAAAYYLKVVATMYFRLPLASPDARGGFSTATAVALCAAGVVLLGIFPGPLQTEADRASPSAAALQSDEILPAEAFRGVRLAPANRPPDAVVPRSGHRGLSEPSTRASRPLGWPAATSVDAKRSAALDPLPGEPVPFPSATDR